MILTDGNPLRDIHMIDRDHVRFVMKDGVIYKNTIGSHVAASRPWK